MQVARRWLLVLTLAFVSTGCRDKIAIPGEPLEVLAVAVAQADVVQGEGGVAVTVDVRNASAFLQRIGSAQLAVSVDGADATASFVLLPDAGNPVTVEPDSNVTLLFELAAAPDAPAGTASASATVVNGTGIASIPAPQPASFAVLRHAQLEIVSQTADGPSCRDIRISVLRIHVLNSGESVADLQQTQAVITRDDVDVSAEFALTASLSNPASIAPGGEADIDFSIASDLLTGLGAVEAAIEVTADDARSAVDASPAGAAPAALDVHQPATLAVTTVTETRTTVSKGQTGLAVTVNVTNTGSVPATLDAGTLSFAIGASGTNADYTVTPPTAGTVIPAGGNVDLGFAVAVKAAAASGATVLGAQADATDDTCGESPTSSPAVTPGAWTVQSPPSLSASVVSSVSDTWAGGTTTVTLTVTNSGEATAMAVAPSISVSSCPTCAALTAVDTNAENVAGGGNATYQWTAALSVPLPSGQDVAAPSFGASGTGLDANTLGSVSSATASDATTVEALRPVACFTSAPTATGATGNNPFSLDAACSSDVETADGSLVFDWDWTDDGTFDDTGITQTFDYTTEGKKIAALRVTDAHGRDAEVAQTLIVEVNDNLGCVTTLADESDAAATPAAPGNTGFSLREAINWAGATAGRQTICFDAGLAGQTITFTQGVLPGLNSAGVYIAGRRDITIDFGNLPYGFRTRFDSELRNLRLTGVAPGGIAKIVVGGASVDVVGCEIFGGGGAGIAWDETQSTSPVTDLDVNDNDIHDNETDGIRLAPLNPNDVEAEILRNRIRDNGASGIDASRIGNLTTFGRNLIHDNGSHGIVSGGDDVFIVNNTIAFNDGDGLRLLDCSCGTNNDFWNNVIVDNNGYGIQAIGGNPAGADSLGTNWVFDNDMGETFGTIAIVASDEIGTSDPELEPDFELARTSPCRNAGNFLAGTPDANSASTGNFYGAGVDVGSWESPR